jgi:hypothetical protein
LIRGGRRNIPIGVPRLPQLFGSSPFGRVGGPRSRERSGPEGLFRRNRRSLLPVVTIFSQVSPPHYPALSSTSSRVVIFRPGRRSNSYLKYTAS